VLLRGAAFLCMVESLKNFFKNLKKNMKKKGSKIFGDTLSRIVIDHICTIDWGRTGLGMLRTCARVPRARALAARAQKNPPALQRYSNCCSDRCSLVFREISMSRHARYTKFSS
jgi:hypothetical protein